ncbi:MAG: chemotaxis protein CheW [Candidatus Omnitrophota bacterium]
MKVVIFSLADKDYGVDIERVREVIRMREITPIPDTAEFVEGVINLRGKVIPVINLRTKLGLERKKLANSDRILITKIKSNLIGLLVDQAPEVITIDQASIVPPDDLLKDADYLIGVAKLMERLVLITNIEKLLNAEAAESIQKIEEKVEVRKKQDK